MASATLSYSTLAKQHRKLQNRVKVALKQIKDLEEQLADYADAESDPGSSGAIPNNEMRWLSELKLTRETLTGKEAD